MASQVAEFDLSSAPPPSCATYSSFLNLRQPPASDLRAGDGAARLTGGLCVFEAVRTVQWALTEATLPFLGPALSLRDCVTFSSSL